MSDSGFSGYVPRLHDPRSVSSAQPMEAVRLISAPADIIPETRPVRVQGEVSSVSSEGRVRIETKSGPVIIEAREGLRRQLSRGDRVEVEIPPENYDRQARMRELPAAQDTKMQTPDNLPRESHSTQNPSAQNRDTESRATVSNTDDSERQENTGRLIDTATGRGDISVAKDIRISDIDEAGRRSAGLSETTGQSPSIIKEGEVIRLSAFPPGAESAIVPPRVAVAAMTAFHSSGAALTSFPGDNREYLSAVSSQARSNLFRDIASILGGTPPQEQTGQINLQRFMTADQQNDNLNLLSRSLPGITLNFALNTPVQTDREQNGPNSFAYSLSTGALISGQAGNLFSDVITGQTGMVTASITTQEANDAPKKGQISNLDTSRAAFGGITPPQNEGQGPSKFGARTSAPDGLFAGLSRQSQLAAQMPASTKLAQIVAQTRDNLPVLQFSFSGGAASVPGGGLFIPDSGIGDLPTGAFLSLGAFDSVSAQGIFSLQSPLPGQIPSSLQSGQWQLMEDIRQTLFQTTPQTAQVQAASLPGSGQSPVQIVASALFFISALRSGDLSSWLGNPAQSALKQAGRTDLIDTLKNEGRAVNRMVGESGPQSDWRVNAMPFLWEGQIDRIMLWSRPEPDPDDPDDKKGEGATRFVFDLNLDHMGDVQIDGLVRPSRLDIVLRTESGLSQAMRQTMRQGYAKALNQTDLTGELHFQGQPRDHTGTAPGAQNWSELV